MKYTDYKDLKAIIRKYFGDMNTTEKLIEELEDKFIITPRIFEIRNPFKTEMMLMSDNNNP